MEKSFSQRMGIKKVKLEQTDSMDDDLKVAIWNAIYKAILTYYEHEKSFTEMNNLAVSLWTDFYKKPIDDAPYVSNYQYWHQFVKQFKENYFNLKWHQIYDLMEYLMNSIGLISEHQQNFTKECNIALTKELSAYRVIGKRLSRITLDEEIQEIDEALAASKLYTSHIDNSLKLLTSRESPDYRNSIKESISAVEAICQLITGDNKATLGKALKKLETKLGIHYHPTLAEAFTKLYGYTSDAKGIRHAILGDSHIDYIEAKFMLVVCSAFVNYLLTSASEAGLELELPQ